MKPTLMIRQFLHDLLSDRRDIYLDHKWAEAMLHDAPDDQIVIVQHYRSQAADLAREIQALEAAAPYIDAALTLIEDDHEDHLLIDMMSPPARFKTRERRRGSKHANGKPDGTEE
jgi:hypothetical protein